MTTALWIIAICSIVRIVQNGIQLSMLIGERDLRKQLNNEFIDSLSKDNKEWAEDLLKRFVEAEQTEPQFDKDINVRSKTENCSEKPNNSTISKMEQVEDEPQIDNLATAIANEAYCRTCKHLLDEDCDCDIVFTGYEPKDEPQTDCAWK